MNLTNTQVQQEDAGAEQNTVTLYLVRHGKTILNALDRVQGWSDAVLTPAGTEKVVATGIGLKDVPFRSIYSSDSGRAVQTAKIIASESSASPDLEVRTDPRLREFNFGSYEGEHSRTMHEDVAAANDLDLASFRRLRTPQMIADSIAKLDREKRGENTQNWPAEDYQAIRSRVTDILNSIVTQEAGRGGPVNVLAVSHGLTIAAILTILDDDTRHKLARGLENASVSTVIYRNGNYTVGKINDMSYAEAGETLENAA